MLVTPRQESPWTIREQLQAFFAPTEGLRIALPRFRTYLQDSFFFLGRISQFGGEEGVGVANE